MLIITYTNKHTRTYKHTHTHKHTHTSTHKHAHIHKHTNTKTNKQYRDKQKLARLRYVNSERTFDVVILKNSAIAGSHFP